MVIDELKQYPLTSYLNKTTKHSDHNTEIIDLQNGVIDTENETDIAKEICVDLNSVNYFT